MLRESWQEAPFVWRFILAADGKTPVPCHDWLQFALWMEAHQHEMHVGDTYFQLKDDQVRVSTVFLGLRAGVTLEPLLFETMVFRPEAEMCDRYHTWDEAAAGHDIWVKFFEANGYEQKQQNVQGD